MHILTHTYEDFDGQIITEELRFHISRLELARNLHLRDEFEGLQTIIEGERRELTPAEIRKILDLVGELMKLAYGVRGEKEGRTVFTKNESIWESFKDSAIYDSFLFWLFEEKDRVNNFMTSLLPAELREQAAKTPIEDIKDPTSKDLMNMSREDLLELMKKRNQEDPSPAPRPLSEG